MTMTDNSHRSLAGRTAVVTGATRGIGAAIAEALCEAGCQVMAAGRNAEQLEALVLRLKESGLRAFAHVCDVTSVDQIAALEKACRREFGPAHILVNNAGVASAAPLLKLELAEWNRLIAVNATGPFLCTKAFLPGMLEEGYGRVVTVASTAALRGAPYISAYAASKHAALGFVRSMAAELADKSVTVNAICPGYVDTEMTTQTVAALVAKTGRTPQNALAAVLRSSGQERLIQPQQIAQVLLELCLDAESNGRAVEIL